MGKNNFKILIKNLALIALLALSLFLSFLILAFVLVGVPTAITVYFFGFTVNEGFNFGMMFGTISAIIITFVIDIICCFK